MRICIHKSTKRIIEMQSYAAEGTLIQNAINGGYALADIEEQEVDDAGYAAAKAEDPVEVAAAEAEQARKDKAARILQEIIDNLPAWSTTSSAIDGAWSAGAQRNIIKKLARTLYLVAKNEET